VIKNDFDELGIKITKIIVQTIIHVAPPSAVFEIFPLQPTVTALFTSEEQLPQNFYQTDFATAKFI